MDQMIDKDGANPQKIYEQLSQMNILVEAWGGKFQNQELSAKQGLNVDTLLEKVILESDLLDLKANPNREGSGSIIEASLDKGRGYVATILVQNGTLRQGDLILSGQFYGRVKAMFNERNQRIEVAPPSTPVVILGLNGAPQAGEKFRMYEDEAEAKEIAGRRAQILREHFDRNSSWRLAVALYHTGSRNTQERISRGNRYSRGVFNKLANLGLDASELATSTGWRRYAP